MRARVSTSRDIITPVLSRQSLVYVAAMARKLQKSTGKARPSREFHIRASQEDYIKAEKASPSSQSRSPNGRGASKSRTKEARPLTPSKGVINNLMVMRFANKRGKKRLCYWIAWLILQGNSREQAEHMHSNGVKPFILDGISLSNHSDQNLFYYKETHRIKDHINIVSAAKKRYCISIYSSWQKAEKKQSRTKKRSLIGDGELHKTFSITNITSNRFPSTCPKCKWIKVSCHDL